MSARVVLVSCVKSKRRQASPAKDLYISQLFRGMRRYAEQFGDVWFILSAKHGLLHPDQSVAPYELTLNTMKKAERLRWAAGVQEALSRVLPEGAQVTVLAGIRYRENLTQYLEGKGFKITVPMAGLNFGSQLRWLKEHAPS